MMKMIVIIVFSFRVFKKTLLLDDDQTGWNSRVYKIY